MEEKEVKLVKKKKSSIEAMKLSDLVTLRECVTMICEDYETSLIANQNEPSFKEQFDEDLIQFNKYKKLNKEVFKLIKDKVDSLVK